MRITSYQVAVVISLVFAQLLSARDANWPQWRGPNRDDVSQETGLLQDWPEGGPPLVWMSRECGLGYSGPAVVGDRLYILGARDGEELLICFQVSDGKELWSASIGPILDNAWGDGPRSTPTVDGDLIYALGGQGNLICCQITDGSRLWSKSMTDFGGELPKWGFAESPLVHNEKLLWTPGGEKGAIVALDKISGDLLWQTEPLTDIAHYSSIVVTEHGGKSVGVQLLVSQLVGFDTENGEVLWTIPWPGRTAVIPTPVLWDNRIYATSGYGVGCMMVEMGENNSATPVYDNNLMVNHHGGVIRIGEHLFGHSNNKGWTCQEFNTGEEVWRERDVLGKGAIAYADNRFYCLSEDEGDVALIAATTEGWQEHGRFRISPQTEQRSDRGRIWTHPVIAGGRLYLRDQELLFCYDVTEK